MGEKTAVIAATAEQRTKAMQLYRMGWSLREIGAHLGVSHQGAANWINAELEQMAKHRQRIAKRVFELDLQRLDDLMKVLYPRALKADLPAVDRMLKVMERRAKMLGYDKEQGDKSEGGLEALLVKAFQMREAKVVDVEPEDDDAEDDPLLPEKTPKPEEPAS